MMAFESGSHFFRVEQYLETVGNYRTDVGNWYSWD